MDVEVDLLGRQVRDLLCPGDAKQLRYRRYSAALRARIPLIAKPDMLVMTRGIASLPADDIAAIMEKVRTFDGFNGDNDPWAEHDCASFDHDGRRIMFKIDDHGGHNGLRLVLTVLLVEEW